MIFLKTKGLIYGIRATNLAIEQADVEGGTTEHCNDIFDFLTAIFARSRTGYNNKVVLILELESVVDAVHFLKSAGSGVSCPGNMW